MTAAVDKLRKQQGANCCNQIRTKNIQANYCSDFIWVGFRSNLQKCNRVDVKGIDRSRISGSGQGRRFEQKRRPLEVTCDRCWSVDLSFYRYCDKRIETGARGGELVKLEKKPCFLWLGHSVWRSEVMEFMFDKAQGHHHGRWRWLSVSMLMTGEAQALRQRQPQMA